jgi:hypothetical protein
VAYADPHIVAVAAVYAVRCSAPLLCETVLGLST